MIIYSPTFTGSVQITGSQTVTGDLTVQGNLTAQTFILSSSVSYFTESFASGSTRFGDSMDDTMVVTGSLRLTGSIGINTTAPAAALDARIPGESAASGKVALIAGTGNGINDIFRWFDGTTQLGVIENNGNVGILNTDPQARLHIGSALFSSSDITNGLILKQTSTNETTGIYLERSGERKGYAIYVGGTADSLNFQRNNAGTKSDVMTLTRDALVGIRNTNPARVLDIFGDGIKLGDGGSFLFDMNVGASSAYFINFAIGATNLLRLRGDGYFGVNCSPSYRFHVSADECGNYAAQFHNTNSGDCGGSGVLILQGGTFNSSGDTTSRYISVRRGDGTEIGAIRRNGATNVAFETSSDYRLKEDLKEINGLDKVSQIKVYDFQWKDTTDRMDGVLAHELQEVIPYAVSGVKDETNGEGKPQYQGVDYSKLVPTLIKAVQELKAEIDELKNK